MFLISALHMLTQFSLPNTSMGVALMLTGVNQPKAHV